MHSGGTIVPPERSPVQTFSKSVPMILGVVGIIMQSRCIQSMISLILRSDLLFMGRMCEFVMQPFPVTIGILLGSPVGNLNSIGAQFRVDGDDVHFLFSEESTLHYTHSLENIKLIVMRTYFPADDRFGIVTGKQIGRAHV